MIGEIFMKKIVSILLATVLTFSFSLTAFAVTAADANAARDSAKETFDNLAFDKFDVDDDEHIAAADARLVLLYSAGLRTEEAKAAAAADIDGDGKVSAVDARTVLRVSSKLENATDYYTDSEKLAYFNAILNTARPNNYYLYKNGVEYTANVSYTDPNGVVKKLDDAFDRVESSVGEEMNFAAELTNAKGERVYSGNTIRVSSNSKSYAANKMMIIHNENGADDKVSSYLTVDDVTKVEHKTNQTYTFVRYGTKENSNGTVVIDTSNVIYTESVTGLDSLTVYLKSDNNIKGEHSSKAFEVYSQEQIDSEIQSVAKSFESMSADLSILGNMQFNVTPSVGDIKYYNAYITVYYHPNSGEIVAAYYSMYTDYTMGLYMDVDISIPLYVMYVDAEGPVNITTKTLSTKEYYFISNNENHVDW